jgi:molybdopterin-synthase adenylyltransferase
LVVADLKDILSFLEEQVKDNCIDLADVQKAAGTFACSLRDIEEIALSHSILPARFQRNGLSCSEQLKLFQARVAIIGCGGLGGRTAELLSRIGIGHLILTDPDIFSESNLNRQMFCTVDTLGFNKVDIVGGELQKINPALKTTKNIGYFKEQSITDADIVIDCLDSPQARKELSGLCLKNGLPLVHGAVKRWYGQVGVEIPPNTFIPTLYPNSHTTSPSPPHVLSMTVAFIASIQVAETCKYLLNHESPLQQEYLQCDLLHCDFEKIPNTITTR